MAEHWCKVHSTKFFKTEKMSSYAHPVKDGDGKTISWCNEDAEAVAKLEPQEPISPPLQEGEPTPEQLKPFDPTRKSIERQTSLKAATDWCIAKLQGGADIKTTELITVAGLFESYLENGIQAKKK